MFYMHYIFVFFSRSRRSTVWSRSVWRWRRRRCTTSAPRWSATGRLHAPAVSTELHLWWCNYSACNHGNCDIGMLVVTEVTSLVMVLPSKKPRGWGPFNSPFYSRKMTMQWFSVWGIRGSHCHFKGLLGNFRAVGLCYRLWEILVNVSVSILWNG